jgi:hypothetical protein
MRKIVGGKMDEINQFLYNINITSLIIGGIISFIITLIGQYFVPKLFSKIFLSLKNKYFSHEQIIGEFYGYYLHKDTKESETILRESNWKISADFKKENYIVTIYRNDDSKKRKIVYKGNMWVQGDHYLLQLDSHEYEETIFERKIKGTKTNEYPIIGIGLAINSQRKIRANISALSKKRLSLNDFNKIVKEHKVILEKETYNLKIDI